MKILIGITTVISSILGYVKDVKFGFTKNLKLSEISEIKRASLKTLYNFGNLFGYETGFWKSFPARLSFEKQRIFYNPEESIATDFGDLIKAFSILETISYEYSLFLKVVSDVILPPVDEIFQLSFADSREHFILISLN